MFRMMVKFILLFALIVISLEIKASNKLIIDSVDWVPIAETDPSIQKLGDAVGILRIPFMYQRCTAFFINEYEILTAAHCVSSTRAARGAEFTISETYRFKCDGLVKTNRYLDFTILRCRKKHHAWIPLKRITAKVNDKIFIIHVNCDWRVYKNCMPEKVVSKDYIHRVWYRDYIHRADTLGGSSGAPVFNSKGELIAIHHSGSVINYRGLKGPYNFASKIINILDR